jgi:hypothetical protein
MRGMAVTVSRAFGEGVAGHLLSEGGLKLLKLAVEKPPFGCGRLRLYPGSVIRFPGRGAFMSRWPAILRDMICDTSDRRSFSIKKC